MSVFNPQKAISSVIFDRFRGIDTRYSRNSAPSANDMVNFRIGEDGSLKKRHGITPIASCSDQIRAVWSGRLNGSFTALTVYGNTVAKIDAEARLLIPIGNINSASGSANFIFFEASLYLKDHTGFYLITENGVSAVEGYAPLYAKDWPSAETGEINEPLNLMSRHVRMQYTVTEPNIYLRVAHKVSQIDAVYVNGTLRVDPSSYYFDASIMCVCVTGMNVGDKIELFLTLDSSEIDSDGVLGCTHAFVYGGPDDSRFFLWGGERGDVIYGSSDIAADSYDASKRIYTASMPLYVKETDAFTMGRERQRITAVCRHYDRMLIFTEKDTWMVNEPANDGEPLRAMLVNSALGCMSQEAVDVCGNDPVCVSKSAILRWNADTDELNECNAEIISGEISSLLKKSFFENARVFVDKKRNEICFSDPTDAEGIMWIYSANSKNWYKYDGIGAELFFELDLHDCIGFAKGNALFYFDAAADRDTLPDGTNRPIKAYFESFPLDFSAPEAKKRLRGMALVMQIPDNSAVDVEYFSNGETIASFKAKSNGKTTISKKQRLNSKRFTDVTLRLTSEEGTAKIYSAGIWIKP